METIFLNTLENSFSCNILTLVTHIVALCDSTICVVCVHKSRTVSYVSASEDMCSVMYLCGTKGRVIFCETSTL